MTQKRFGPTQDAGVAVIEKTGAAAIEPATLGVTAHVGIYEKGKIGELITTLTSEEFARKVGGRISESLAPDAAYDFFDTSTGAGFLNISRIVDGTEKTAEKIVYSREEGVRSEVMKVKAYSPGSWAGRRAEFVDEYVAVTETTLDTGRSMEIDEYKNAIVTLDALPGKSYKVISNDAAGILTFSSDTKLATDITDSGSSDLLYNVILSNESDKVVEFEIYDGTDNPSTEFRVVVYEDGIKVRDYDNLSNDPLASNYYVPTINDDGANDYIEVEDLNLGEPTANKRPANYYRDSSLTLSTLTLTTRISEQVDDSVNNAKSTMTETLGARIIDDDVTLTCTTAGSKASGSVTIANNSFDPAVQASGTIQITNNTFDAGDIVTINGVDFEALVDFSGASTILSATSLVSAINSSLDPLINGIVTADNGGGTLDTVTITAVAYGVAGNAITLAETDNATDNFTLSGATLAGGFDGDSVTINGEQFYFGVGLDVVPGATADDTAEAFKDAINANTTLAAILNATRVGAIVTIEANSAGTAGNAYTLVEDDGSTDNFTLSGATLSGGVDQVWSYASARMPFITANVTTGVAFAPPNDFALGFTIYGQAGPNFAIGDKIVIRVRPFPVNGLVGGYLIPNTGYDATYIIDSNTANSISVVTGNDLTSNATAGDPWQVIAKEQLAGGYDGIANILDQDYIDAWNTNTSVFNGLFGQNVGLVKLATPGITTPVIQKAGANYANARNYTYRHEIPANITDETSAYNFMADQIGKTDLSCVTFPSFVYITNPDGAGLKLTTATGMIQGREALIAKNYQGYHKAAAGTDVTLPNVVKLPTGDKELNGEFLNPRGINRIRKKEGNFILWGDRMFTTDTNFKFKHVREYLSHIENIFRENFDYIVFALNNKDNQEQLKTTFRAFFIPEFANGAIVGDSLEDAAIIKIDDENNTNATRAQGDLNAEISLDIVDTVERLIITIGKQGIFDSSAS